MWTFIIIACFSAFVATCTWLSYYLGQTKVENPKSAAALGFILSFAPPVAMIYLIILTVKEDVTTV